jgi:putative hemolysin
MELITPRDLVDAVPVLKVLGGQPTANMIIRLLDFDKVNDAYSRYYGQEPQAFIQSLIDHMRFRYTLSDEEMENIPKEKSFITISNHPYGGIEGILLMKIIPSVRPDFKIIVNFLLTKLDPLKPYFLGVNPFETHKDLRSSYGGLKDAFVHLNHGHPIGIFPAGEVSTFKFNQNAVTDKEWQHSILKFIKKANVPILPIYFDGHNSKLFHLLGMIHPMLRTAKLPSEMFNKQGKNIMIRIGPAITVKEQEPFRDIGEFGKFLRMRTYNLGLPYEKKRKSFSLSGLFPDRIIEPVDPLLIQEEIARISDEYRLFSLKGNSVFCCPAEHIPNIMREIARLREITYREVGEGTGKGLDTDEYDSYFEQLFIWDDAEKQIIGGYRIGKGEHILERHGIKGFYIQSLFRIDEKFAPILKVSIELGRSFVTKAYQRKPLSLFLLWKGILYLLLKNPKYRYLIGPVSIPNAYSDLGKSLTVNFLVKNHFNSEFAEYIKPRKEYKCRIDRRIDLEIFHKYTEKDVARLDRFIQDFDPAFRLPILFKKYINVNAEIVGFNVDPKFNNCLDALMMLDLFEVPFDTIETLSKEINDQSILERFKK